MPKITAPNGSTWHRKDDKYNADAAWENDNGEAVTIEKQGEETRKIPESEWVGSGGATRETIQHVEVTYPDGLTVDENDFEDAKETVREWMKQYPDEKNEYGALK